MMRSLEEADARLRDSGISAEWFRRCDDTTLAVSGQCNGHLFEQLLRASGYVDVDCVNLLREGRSTGCSHMR